MGQEIVELAKQCALVKELLIKIALHSKQSELEGYNTPEVEKLLGRAQVKWSEDSDKVGKMLVSLILKKKRISTLKSSAGSISSDNQRVKVICRELWVFI